MRKKFARESHEINQKTLLAPLLTHVNKYSMRTVYDIIDTATGERVVEGLNSYDEAYYTSESIAQEGQTLAVVERTKYTVKPGFGRDPDLH